MPAALGRREADASAASYVEADKSDADLALGMGRVIARRDSRDAVRLFRRGLQVRHDAKDCADDAVKRSVGDALELRPEDERVADAVAIASELCWDQLQEPVINRFIAGDRTCARTAARS